MSKSPSKDSNSNWSFYMRNLISHKKHREAILIYTRNRASSNTTLGAVPLVIKACASIYMISLGKTLHCETVKLGVEFNVMVGTSLVDMYGKCRDVVSARKLFDFMPERNAVTWNAMIGGYVKGGDFNSANILFEKMAGKTSVTWNQMIDGYARSGDMAMARRVFDNMPKKLKTVVSTTVMVDGYISNGDMEAAKEMFETMAERNFYVWSVMISGFFKKGDVENARSIFDRMSLRNLVIWNTLISGYVQNGLYEKALDAFNRMQAECFEPDEVTVVSVLSACAQLGLLDFGKKIHEMIVFKKIELNEFVLNGLADMYVKCGDLREARLIFEQMSFKNCTSWNVLISGFAIHGHCREALDFFSRMEKSGVKPDGLTFLSVLFACAHGGLVEEGLEAFNKMKKYGLIANIKHYGCLVDLLGRAGKLKEALEFVKGMPVEPNDIVLGALLGACRIHSNTVMAERALEFVNGLNSDAHCVLLSNIFAASERWQKAQGMRVTFRNKGLEKVPGCSEVILS